MPANDDVGDYSQPADADSWSVHVVEVANDDGLLEPRKKNNRLAVPNGTKLREIMVKRAAYLPAKSAKFRIKRHLAKPLRRSNMLNLVPLLAVPIFLTESDIENLNVSIFDYLTEADAKTALSAPVSARFTTFDTAARNHLWNVIAPADVPGGGGGGYAAGQAVLNGDISAIETYRISKGW